jgi:mono/diheme cytochrome c family protein
MSSASRVSAASGAALLLLALGGCRQDMAVQPKLKPLAPSAFFGDGRSARPPVENTVARGALADEDLQVPKDSVIFPLPVTKELLERGRERYNIFCSPCHGLQGDGNGIVAVRGMKHPPTYHQDRLRRAPAGYIYDVIAHGFGAMYDYSAQVPPRDRWAIIAYVRALQLSRNAPAADLPEELRRKLSDAGSPAKAPLKGGAEK